MICLLCNKDFNIKNLSRHIRYDHKITLKEYEKDYLINTRICKKCDGKLQLWSENIFCNKCRDRSGSKNSFYGKTHTSETMKILQEKCSIETKKLWENKEYRTKVINNATGKTRSLEFKQKQKIAALKQFENIDQRKLRSIIMSKSWKDGAIVPTIHSCNESKMEKEFFKDIEQICPFSIEKYTIRNRDRTKWFFPDCIIHKNIVIEFNGDYWHANPKIYNETDIVHHNLTAKEIWETDKKRIKEIEDCGYFVYQVWEYDYKRDLKKILSKINQILNWEDLC